MLSPSSYEMFLGSSWIRLMYWEASYSTLYCYGQRCRRRQKSIMVNAVGKKRKSILDGLTRKFFDLSP